ncbi:hypothetical protein PV10_07284 [Exophiala mesophila]|uniref:FAD/NAD(P)-binding domain-containing protein n=1 Tax=Exophiala mesophila TaxID=212818 RepID=A0A0D1Z542_EXOME|nr:uncharacterized protein PV10_07284 [Exophiala mesophila]KIV89927.1 hypothetical protein PV10_07284 [Exophiala mesophila]
MTVENTTNGASPNGGTVRPKLVIDEDHYLYQPKRLRIVGIGAGLSGIILAYKAKHEHKMTDEYCDVQIYERLPEAGGTWKQWKYPGVACDVPAANYALTFAPNPNWSHFYSGGEEIGKYCDSVVDGFELRDVMSFNSKVKSATWNEEDGQWHFVIEKNGQIIHDTAHIFFNGSGFTTDWNWPDIPGIDRYKGKLIHAAQWDTSYDYTGKNVALLGNGSTGIQILPAIQPDVKHLTTFIRSPTWITPGFAAEHTPTGDGANFKYPDEQRALWRKDPEAYFKYRKQMEEEFNLAYNFTNANSELQKQRHELVKQMMEEGLKDMDPELRKKLIPDWAVGCRRITPGEGYLAGLQKPNVSIEMNEITELTETGLKVSSGKEYEFDLIICATGFDASLKPHFDIIGENGKKLGDGWVQEDGPPCYMGRCYSGFPNMFMSLAANSVFAHGSLIPALDLGVDYMLRAAKRMSEEGIKSMSLKQEAWEEFDAYQREFNKRTVWETPCRSWYKSNTKNGKALQYPGSVLHFRQVMDRIRWEDYNLKYWSGNRFVDLMRNGLTGVEVNGGDTAYYYFDQRPTKACGEEYQGRDKIVTRDMLTDEKDGVPGKQTVTEVSGNIISV